MQIFPPPPPPGFTMPLRSTRMHVPGLGPLDLARRRREVLTRFQICTPSGGRDARGWEEPPHVLSGKRPETEKPRCWEEPRSESQRRAAVRRRALGLSHGLPPAGPSWGWASRSSSARFPPRSWASEGRTGGAPINFAGGTEAALPKCILRCWKPSSLQPHHFACKAPPPLLHSLGCTFVFQADPTHLGTFSCPLARSANGFLFPLPSPTQMPFQPSMLEEIFLKEIIRLLGRMQKERGGLSLEPDPKSGGASKELEYWDPFFSDSTHLTGSSSRVWS